MKKAVKTFSGILILTFLAGCQFDVPIKEMVNARQAIKRAYEVKADTYAPEELKEAEDRLYTSHANLDKDDVDKAKKLADESRTAAEAAIEKSLPLLARDTLAQAKQTYDQAEKLYAEKYASEEFTRAGVLIAESENLNTQGQYWDSYLKSREAISAASSAITTSESQLDVLRVELETIKTSLGEIKARELEDDARASVSDIESFISVAETDLQEKDLKRATAHIAEASSRLDTLKLLLAESELKTKITELRDETESLKNERGADFAADDIDSITAALNDAETSLTAKNFDETRTKISSAETMLKTARENTERGIAAEKLAAVTRLRDELAGKDKNGKFTAELTSSGALISAASELLDKGSSNESLQKSIEAETLLNTVSVTMEKEYGIVQKPEETTDAGLKDMSGTTETRIYVVQYYKKDKDCLWRIAQKVYKDARQWPRIYVANRDQIKDPDLIFPGQKFIIPPLTAPEKKQDDTIIINDDTAENINKPADESGQPR